MVQGRAKGVRYVALNAASDLNRPEIEALMASALKLAKPKLDASTKHSLIIKTGGEKKRARGAKSAAARPSSVRRKATGRS
jgi:hypothetical protein